MEKLLYFCTSLLSSLVNTGKEAPRAAKRILLVKLDEIGDVIYNLHCFEALCNRYPDAEIVLWCKPMNNILVKQFPQIQAINNVNNIQGRFDIQIDFRGNWKSLLWPLTGKSTYYLERGSTRFYYKLNGGQVHETTTNKQTILPLFDLAYPWPEPRLRPSEEDKEAIDALLSEMGITDFVVMHTGARDELRRWPQDRFRDLASEIHENYGLHILFVGGPNEDAINEPITAKLPFAHNIAGRTSLLELSELTRKARFFIGNESGPMHFAVINKTPLVALFGPGVKDVFYPLHANQHVLHHLDKQPAQVTDITVQEVLNAVNQIMQH